MMTTSERFQVLLQNAQALRDSFNRAQEEIERLQNWIKELEHQRDLLAERPSFSDLTWALECPAGSTKAKILEEIQKLRTGRDQALQKLESIERFRPSVRDLCEALECPIDYSKPQILEEIQKLRKEMNERKIYKTDFRMEELARALGLPECHTWNDAMREIARIRTESTAFCKAIGKAICALNEAP